MCSEEGYPKGVGPTEPSKRRKLFVAYYNREHGLRSERAAAIIVADRTHPPEANQTWLPLIYQCFTPGFPLVNHWTTHGKPLVYHWFTMGLPMVYHWFAIGSPLTYHWFT